MSDTKAQLQAELKEAMKSKDNDRRNVIRLVQSAIKQEEVDSGKSLDEDAVIVVIQKEAKKRREAISDYEKADRADLAAEEQKELDILEDFLPKQLSHEEVEVIVKEVIAETGAESQKDMGKVMGPVMARVKGVADGKMVNQIVREQLNA